MTEAPVITTARLTLRPHRREDFAALHALWSLPAVYRFIAGVPPDQEQSWARLTRYFGVWPMLGFGFWAIEHEGRYVGEAGLANFNRLIDPPLGDDPEAGWVLHPGHHGRGLAEEAMRAIFAWSDINLKPKQVMAIMASANQASLALAGKLGFTTFCTTTYHGEPTLVLRRPTPL